MIRSIDRTNVSDVHRWKQLKYLDKLTFNLLLRYPVLADRALHEIERLWSADFAKFTEKQKIKIYESTSWWSSLSPMQRSTASTVAQAYCKEQMERLTNA